MTSGPTPEFKKIITDFINDIQTTFPEYSKVIEQWWDVNNEEKSVSYIYNYCMKVYPERLFEILYQNVELFSLEKTEYNTEFLPGISFKYIWSSNITDKTKETIWKYLQLVIISLISNIQDKNLFGDTTTLLENVDSTDFKSKLEETLENIQSLFSEKEKEKDTEEEEEDKYQLPSTDDIQGHISNMLQGKLGNLAKEIAEETADNMNIDLDDNITEPQDIFKTLFADPSKLMNLVKNVSSKLDNKIKSGEINESELFSEAGQMMNQMKSIPGMDNIHEMISKLNLGKSKGKVDQNAMEQQLKKHQMREQMRKKSEDRKLNKILNETANELLNSNQYNKTPAMTDEALISLFNKTEKTKQKPKKKI